MDDLLGEPEENGNFIPDSDMRFINGTAVDSNDTFWTYVGLDPERFSKPEDYQSEPIFEISKAEYPPTVGIVIYKNIYFGKD